MGKCFLLLGVLGLICSLAVALDPEQGSLALTDQHLHAYISKFLKAPTRRLPVTASALQGFSEAPNKVPERCGSITKALSSASPSPETFDALYVGLRFRCFDGKETRQQAAKALAAQEASSIETFEKALRAATLLQTPLSGEQQSKLSKIIIDGVTPSGKVRSKKGSLPSLQVTGLTYSIIAALKAASIKLSSEANSAVASLKSQAPEVISQAASSKFNGAGESNGLAAAAALLEGFVALKLNLDSSDTALQRQLDASLYFSAHKIGEFLSEFQAPGTVQEAAYLLRARRALTALGGSFFKLQLTQGAAKAGAKVGVVARGIDGTKVELSSLTGESVTSGSGSAKSDELKIAASGGQYSIDTANLPAGKRHQLNLKGTVGSDSITSTLQLTILGTLEISGATVVLENEDGSTQLNQQSDFPKSLPPFQAPANSLLKVTIAEADNAGRPVASLSCSASDEALVLSFERAEEGLVAKQKVSSISSHFSPECSQLQLTISEGDPLYSAFVWEVAKITLDRVTSQAVIKSSSSPQPVISHQFNAPQKRPLKGLSLLFTIAALLPLGFLAASLLNMGINFQVLCKSSSSKISAASFHIGLVGLVLVYVAFWLKLDLLTTLIPLSILALWLAVSGYFFLSHLSEERLKQA